MNTENNSGNTREAGSRSINERQVVVVDATKEIARAIIKRISDSAIELAFIRHGLISDEFDEDESQELNERAAAQQAYVDDVKSDILDCLTGDETGCNDPEDLNETNCELVWLRGQLSAPSPTTSALVAALEEALPVVKFYATLLEDPGNRSYYLKIGQRMREALSLARQNKADQDQG